MNKYKWILTLMVIVSWATIPFLGWRNIKRFSPAAVFMSGFILVESHFAKKWKWWIILQKLHSKLTVESPFIFGPFMAGSLWLLTLSYGNIFFYLSLNAIVDGIFIYPFNALFTRLGIFKQGRLKKYQLWLLFLAKSMIMYGIQHWMESFRKTNLHRSSVN
ncbi:hypothetical protein [Falsibacillus albus]|uniref:Uncharacterized protein n=1 Tax=Falsibacillus albus TaxID=2478915 RepID=A0A3L7JSP1_9BACI|nr:hypothetical protein [Falsibacillus albus]RLQ93344.1 hypothetical protein D9X91_17940 [Falsibacillus albus]